MKFPVRFPGEVPGKKLTHVLSYSVVYEVLQLQVLRRDGWMCQSSGTMSSLRSITNSSTARDRLQPIEKGAAELRTRERTNTVSLR